MRGKAHLVEGMEASGIEAVFLAHRDSLLRFLRARGGVEAAEDLWHEVWLRASTAESGPVGEPLAYLYRIANNLMVDRYRSSVRSARRDQQWSDVAAAAMPGASDAPSSERVLIARDELRRAEAALAALGERTATIFRRYRIEGVNQRDIAQELGVSLSTVEKDLQRAYRAMIDFRRRTDAG